MSESSPVREPNGSSTAEGKELTECPSCGRDDFKNERGVKMHHKMKHGESIAGVELTCEICSETYRVQSVDAKKSRFCSRECHSEHQKTETGSNNNNYKPRVEVECEWCGEEEKVTPSRAERYRYCSRECKDDSLTLRTGENHPRYKEKDERKCEMCSSTFEVYPDHHHPARFCSSECYGKWMGEVGSNRGENNGNWKGGHVEYYGSNWLPMRQKALERDEHTCQACGATESLHVHHIQPLRTFDVPEEANTLLNLVTLCASCHGRWEGLWLRPCPAR